MNLEKFNKTPLGSKKFLFAGTICLFWIIIIGLAILYQVSGEAIESMVWACGMTSSLYLGGQSMVDSLVRAAAIKYGGGSNGADE